MKMKIDIAFFSLIIGFLFVRCFQFAEYFRFFQFDEWVLAPIVKVDQRNLYTVKEFYLDDIHGLITVLE